jgi:4-carboxymuconolactone decarboxylase
MADGPQDTPILNLITAMTAASIEASSLDEDRLMLVRLAALIAVDAPAASYLMNLRLAGEVGVDETDVEGVIAAVAPIVGTARIAAAVGHMMKALDLKLDLAQLGIDE